MIFLQDCYVHVLLIVLAVDRGDKEGRAKFLKISLIYFILSFFSKFHEVKNLFSEVLNFFFFSSPVMLRWWQQGGYPFNFGLDDVYVGPPCEENCHRNGVCDGSRCVCDDGFQGTAM